MKLSFTFLLIHCLAIAAAGFAQAESSEAMSEKDEYRLGPEDVLQVQIWERPDLTGQVVVDFSGKIQLPIVGEIEAKGRTLAELSRYLTDRYQLLDPTIPEVMVAVSQYNSQSVTVVGEVRSPGRYGFRTIPDLWAVLLTAGGATTGADLAGVQIVRSEEEEDGTQTVTVDLSRGIEETPREELPDLYPKDTIIVPSFDGTAVPGDKFQVLGAVRSPGMYRISAAETVIEAISVSGGLLPDADLHKVRLTRPTSEGAVSYQLDLHGYLYDARPIADLELKPGDTVTVPSGKKSPVSYVMDGLIRLAPAITAVVSLVYIFER